MNCQEFENKLVEFVEGSLPDGERSQADKHVAECEKCSRLADEFSILWGQMTAPDETGLSPYFRTRLNGKIAEYERTSKNIAAGTPGIARFLKPVGYAALFAFGIISGFKLGSLYSDSAIVKEAVRTPAYIETFESLSEGSFGEVYYNLFSNQ